MEVKTIQQKIEEILNQHKMNTRGNVNVFCTSQELAYMLGKHHHHVLRDIEEISIILRRKGLDNFSVTQVEGLGDAYKFGFTSENQGEIDAYRSEFTLEN